MDHDEIAEMIKRHEGYSNKVYFDTEGIPTVGWGHALIPGSEYPLSMSIKHFEIDFGSALKDYRRLGLKLDSIREAVLVNMVFNLGLPRLMGFKKMIAALRVEDWGEAANQMVDSKWYRQVGVRGRELVKMMRTGEGYII